MKLFFKPKPPVFTLLVSLLGLFLAYCGYRSLEWDDQGNLVGHSYSVWGDWSAHFTFISAIRERGLHWLAGDSPLFQGMPFQYPFLSHVLTAGFGALFRLGTVQATYASSLILLFLLPFAIQSLLKALGLKPWAQITSLLLFLFMGGFQFLNSFILDTPLRSDEALTNQFSQGSIFTQFVVFELIPQRAFLFGILLFTWVTAFWLRRMNAEPNLKRKGKQKDLPLPTSFSLLALGVSGTAVVLSGLTHIHTWITFAVFLLFVFALNPKKIPRPVSRRSVFAFGLAIAFASVILFYFLLVARASPQKMSWDIWIPGWAQNAKVGPAAAVAMNPLWFWIFNTGIFLPLAAVGTYLKRNDEWLRIFAASGFFIFIIAFFFNFQPYYYDNLKLFTYSFFLLAPLAASALEWVATRGTQKIAWGIPAAGLLLVLQCTTGLSDLQFLASQRQTAIFFTAEEIELADQFKGLRHSPEDLVLIVPKHNHWLTCLTGNPVVMGYPGWLWSWGISYWEQEKKVNDIFLGTPDALSWVNHFGVSEIVVNSQEKVADKPVNLAFLQSHFQLLLQKGNWFIFSTQSPPSSVR